MSREILPLRLGAGRFLSRHASPTVWTRTLDHWGFALGCCPIKLHVKRNTSAAALRRETFVSACKPDCVDAYPRSLGFCSGLLSPSASRAKQRNCFSHPCGSMLLRDGASRLPETDKRDGLQSWQPRSYRRLMAYSFLGLSEGA